MSYFLNETNCKKLPLTDERQRYFLDIIRTRLNVGSPLYIQANSFNIFYITQEALNHIKKSKHDEKRYINYLKQTLKELISIYNEDIVYKDLMLPTDIIKDNIEKCIKLESIKNSNYDIELLEYNLKLILSKQEKYEKIAFDKLRYHIFDEDFELTKCERTFSKIRIYNKYLISQLLFRGFSGIYLYNRLEQFLKPANYKGNNFKTQFDKVIGSLLTKKTIISLYLPVRLSKNFQNIAIFKENGFNFLDESLENHLLTSKIKKIRNNDNDIFFLEYKIESTDYLSAILFLNSEIEKISDFYLHGDQPTFYYDIIVKNGSSIQTYNLDKTWKTIFSDQWYINDIKHAYDLKNIIYKFNSESKKTISQSLRYLKVGSKSQNIEQKFLNYWISLESLFSWHKSDSILSAMNSFIPYYSFIDNIKSRLNFIKNILKKYNPYINSVIVNRLDLKVKLYIELKNSELIKIIKSKDDLKKMLDDLNNLEYAKSLILEQVDILKDINPYFEKHKQSCENNLRRIYLYRNQITHQGHYDTLPIHLILLLKSYIYSCYYSLILSNTSIPSENNINLSGNLELTKIIISKNLDKNIYDLFE